MRKAGARVDSHESTRHGLCLTNSYGAEIAAAITRMALISPSIRLPSLKDATAAVAPSWVTRSVTRSAIARPLRTSTVRWLGETAIRTERSASGVVGNNASAPAAGSEPRSRRTR